MASIVSPFRYTISLPNAKPSSATVRAWLSPVLRGRPRDLNRLISNSMSQPVETIPISNQDEDAGKAGNADVLVQYVVLRRDLIDAWPLGSMVTQGCHASVCAIWSHRDDLHTSEYCSPENINSMHKVTLEVKGETQIRNLSGKLTTSGIAHKLWIEQPENIPTCLATKPYPKSLASPFFKKLKLCK